MRRVVFVRDLPRLRREKFLALLDPIDETQEAMLECTAADRLPNSRLSCQIKVRVELDGLVVRMPETQK